MSTWVPASAVDVLQGTPVFGSIEQISAISVYLRGTSLDASSFRAAIQHARQHLQLLTAEAVSALDAKLTEALTPGATALQHSADSAKQALDRYAAEVDRIHREAERLRSQIEEHLAAIRTQSEAIQVIARSIRVQAPQAWRPGPRGQLPEPQLGTSADDLSDAERQLAVQHLRIRYETEWLYAAARWRAAVDGIDSVKTRWAALIEERERVERQLVLALDDTEIGQLITLASGSRRSRARTIALAIAGEVWGSTAGVPELATSHPLLKRLLGTESGEHVWSSPPNPTQVAAAWATLTRAEREQLTLAVPWVIGNLPGLPFAARDAANRRVLEHYAVHRDLLGENSRNALDELLMIVAEGERTEPPVQVVALDLSREVPMVSVGYGHLDTVANLTWQVPGMESDAHLALATWDRASRNLLQAQSTLSEPARAGTVGVVAFLSYDTPDLIDSFSSAGVLSPQLARSGAARLAAELDGAHATRARAARTQTLGGAIATAAAAGPVADPPRIAVTAHSYGTTVAANALTMVTQEVASFTMAGSAGVDTGTVTSLAQLNVAEISAGQKEIFASHASEDKLAPLGIAFGGRANPNANFQYAHAQNYGGALYYSSDGVTTATGEVFRPTNGHSVIGAQDTQWYHLGRHIRHGLGFEATEGHGYWDLETQSLKNLAATSLGLGQLAVGGIYAAVQ